MSWDSNMHQDDMLRNVSQDSDTSTANTTSYNPASQNMMDTNFMSYGYDSTGFQQPTTAQSDAFPSTSFATAGLPFAGLDFIRNYTPGGYDDGQDGLWQVFDGGEFRYDPDLPFSLGEFGMNEGGIQS